MTPTTIADNERRALKASTKAVIPVTVVIPIKNQVGALVRCLEVLGDMAAVVVVDSRSSDDTAEVAHKWGAEVLQFDWRGGFPKKRNWVLQNYPFTTEWVLFLDADEILTSSFISELRSELVTSKFAGYWLRYTNFFQGKQLHFGVPQRKLALFRVGAGSYERIDDPGWSDLDMEVHEHPVLNGPVGELKSRILHDDQSPLFKFIERHNKYSSWEARRYLTHCGNRTESGMSLTFRQRVKYALLESSWLSVFYFVYTYFVRGGLLDGKPGLHYAIYKAMYFFDISRKIAELRRTGSFKSAMNELN